MPKSKTKLFFRVASKEELQYFKSAKPAVDLSQIKGLIIGLTVCGDDDLELITSEGTSITLAKSLKYKDVKRKLAENGVDLVEVDQNPKQGIAPTAIAPSAIELLELNSNGSVVLFIDDYEHEITANKINPELLEGLMSFDSEDYDDRKYLAFPNKIRWTKLEDGQVQIIDNAESCYRVSASHENKLRERVGPPENKKNEPPTGNPNP